MFVDSAASARRLADLLSADTQSWHEIEICAQDLANDLRIRGGPGGRALCASVVYS
jgi:hypothetical protein